MDTATARAQQAPQPSRPANSLGRAVGASSAARLHVDPARAAHLRDWSEHPTGDARPRAAATCRVRSSSSASASPAHPCLLPSPVPSASSSPRFLRSPLQPPYSLDLHAYSGATFVVQRARHRVLAVSRRSRRRTSRCRCSGPGAARVAPRSVSGRDATPQRDRVARSARASRAGRRSSTTCS